MIKEIFNVSQLLSSGGLIDLIIIGAFIYSEVALFLGFFLPGDTLLITAGILAMAGKLSLPLVIMVAIIAAIAGDSTSYLIGRKLGHKIFYKEDSLLFRKDHIRRAEEFYEKYGSKTILIAHFLPVIRTFSPLLAGVGKMKYLKFLSFDVIGDIAWVLVIVFAGYYVGSKIPNIDHYILFVLVAVIVVSLIPTIYHIGKHYLKKKQS